MPSSSRDPLLAPQKKARKSTKKRTKSNDDSSVSSSSSLARSESSSASSEASEAASIPEAGHSDEDADIEANNDQATSPKEAQPKARRRGLAGEENAGEKEPEKPKNQRLPRPTPPAIPVDNGGYVGAGFIDQFRGLQSTNTQETSTVICGQPVTAGGLRIDRPSFMGSLGALVSASVFFFCFVSPYFFVGA
jgi:hypothetical protein